MVSIILLLKQSEAKAKIKTKQTVYIVLYNLVLCIYN